MADVFLSYASEDREAAEKISSGLEEYGLSVWWDRHIPGGVDFTSEIERELTAAKAVIVLWSASARSSNWLRDEAQQARDENKLIPVRLDSEQLPLGFRQTQSLDFSNWNGESKAQPFARLAASAKQFAGHSAQDLFPGISEASVTNRSPRPPLLAVLPFDNLSGDADMLYFSDGISEEILQTVAKVESLRTIGRSSSFQFRGADKTTRRVATELNATHLLDGSVRRSGQRVRVSTQLIDCATQTTLWSERFDRELTDVFALQDEIAAAVAHSLRLAFVPNAQPDQVDTVAYDLYLRAQSTATNWLGGRDATLLEAAVTREPRLTAAWAELALSLAIAATDTSHAAFVESAAAQDLRIRARHAAGRALALDSNSAFAHAALAALAPVCGAFAETERHLLRALSAAPTDPTLLARMGRWCRTVGRKADAFDFAARAYELDPLRPNVINDYASLLTDHDRTAEANALFDRARARWPELFYFGHNALYRAAYRGDWQRVDQLVASIRAQQPHDPSIEVHAAKADRIRNWTSIDGDAAIGELREQLSRTGTIALRSAVEACVHPELIESVCTLLDQASFAHLFEPDGRLLKGDFGLHWLFAESASLRTDIRFVRLCARLGLCDYWISSGRWPDCVAKVAAHYDFKAEALRIVRTSPLRG